MDKALAYKPQMEFDLGKGHNSSVAVPDFVNAKPFVKWVGGKSQLIPALIARFPSFLDYSSTTYIEPFVGGGALFFWLVSHGRKFKKTILNDANPSLINVYRTIRDMPEKLIEILTDIKDEYLSLNNEGRKIFYYEKRNAFNSGTDTPVEHSAHFIFLNRTCFNGLYRVNSKGKFNVPHGRYDNPLICDPETIRADSYALADVEIRCGDFSKAVEASDEHCFIYFDPPYRPLSETSCFCSYCTGGFDDDEQQRLAKCCSTLDAQGAQWLLSNSDPKSLCPNDDFFEHIYRGFHIHSVQANRMLNSNPTKRGKLSELLISNYLVTGV